MGKKNRGKKGAQPEPPSSQHSGRATAEALEQGLRTLTGSAASESSLAASSVSRRRNLEQTRPPSADTSLGSARKSKDKVKGGETHASATATAPAQYVQRAARPTIAIPALTAPAVGDKDQGGSRVVNPAQLRGGVYDPIVSALAGGRLPLGAAPQPEPSIAVPKGTAKPPSRRAKRGPNGGDDSQTWVQWLREVVLGKERSALDSNSNSDDGDGYSRVRAWRKRVASQLYRTEWLPEWARQFILDMVVLFTRARVYLAVGLVVLAILYTAAPKTADAFSAVSGTFTVDEEFRPGKVFLDKFNHGSRTLPHKHPVAIIPGFITGALELWETKGTCLDRQSTSFSTFRQRMFGAQMIFLLLSDPACWMELFGMDKKTGMDKQGIKVRADSGFTSVEYFMPGYWVWAKVLINLADIGYDPQSMAIMTYDWRLSPAMTHERDGFFYSVRNNIKFLCQKNRERAVVISHSYGTTVALAFFKWSEQREPGFMNKYVAYYVNVGGTAMGIPKAASALLMGDVKDTMMIPSVARKAFDTFMSQNSRYNITRSWSCLYSMAPHGCNAAHPAVLEFADGTAATTDDLMDMIIEECERTNHTHCVEQMLRYREEADDLPVLPQAPDTAVVCLYGVNKSSEVGYVLEDVGRRSRLVHDSITGASLSTLTPAALAARAARAAARAVGVSPEESPSGDDDDDDEDCGEDEDCDDDEAVEAVFRQADVAKWMTNTSYNDESGVRQGVRLGNGDGTVPLGSLAYMCRAPNGWVRNAGRVETVEFHDDAPKANPLNLRGAAISGDHVDILGNYDFLETILKIASGIDEVGGQEGMDEVLWAEDDEEHAARISGNSQKRAKGKKRTSGKRNRVQTFHRRVTSRILSNIDELIQTTMSECLEKPNNPIMPKPARDDNEFL